MIVALEESIYFMTLMAKKTLQELPFESLAGQIVILRVDYNVPLGNEGRITDQTRLDPTITTIRHLIQGRARIVIISHLGRPNGKPDPALSLKGIPERLAKLLKSPVNFCSSTTGPEACEAVEALEDGDVLLMENTRFYPGDVSNDQIWAEELRHGSTLFVNDAFGTAHRSHASTTGIAKAVRDSGGQAVAGHLMEKELRFLGDALIDPDPPFVAIIGGSKISGKIDVIEALLPNVDRILVGGAMANTFFLSLGLEVGKSLVEPDKVDIARDIMYRAGDKIILPVDVLASSELNEEASTRESLRTEVMPEEYIADIGSMSMRIFAKEISSAKTIIWNGPMGLFEVPKFAIGTTKLAQEAAQSSENGSTVVLGGGDLAAAVEVAGFASSMTHVSTGGGAALEFLSGAELPGLEALSDRSD
tara:strand:+ start:1273 stop:2529 length:1257 start_codon:yes stop_codon:yes gene_type:complete